MNVVVQLEANIQWAARTSSKSNRWIGVCEPMNMSMEADSLDELHEVINETMQVLLIDLLHDNELERFLKERGWTARNLPQVAAEDDVRFDIPWELIAKGKSIDSERRSH